MEVQVDHLSQSLIDLINIYELKDQKHLEEIMRLEYIMKEQNKVVENLVSLTAEEPTAGKDAADPPAVNATLQILFDRVLTLEQNYATMMESVRSLQEVTGIPEGYCYRLPYRWEGPPAEFIRMGHVEVKNTIPLVLTSTGPAGKTSWLPTGGDGVVEYPELMTWNKLPPRNDAHTNEDEDRFTNGDDMADGDGETVNPGETDADDSMYLDQGIMLKYSPLHTAYHVYRHFPRY